MDDFSSLENSQISYDFSESPEIITKLSDKVKKQAKRLRGLNQYKKLCEKRILELYPDHPIPVTEQDLGTLTTQHEELNSKFSAEKSVLESALRNEMIASEEQRGYIQVLKQKHKEILQITSDSARISELLTEQESATKLLKGSEEALKAAYHEVTRLEEEKSSLLDYIEENTSKGGNNYKTTANYEELKTQLNSQTLVIQNLHQELSAEHWSHGLAKDQITSLKARLSSTEALENTVNQLEAELGEQDNSLNELLQESETYKQQLSKTSEELSFFTSKLSIYEETVKTLLKELPEDSQQHSLESHISFLTAELAQNKRNSSNDFNSLQLQLATLTQEATLLNEKFQAAQESLSHSRQENSAKDSCISTLEAQLALSERETQETGENLLILSHYLSANPQRIQLEISSLRETLQLNERRALSYKAALQLNEESSMIELSKCEGKTRALHTRLAELAEEFHETQLKVRRPLSSR